MSPVCVIMLGMGEVGADAQERNYWMGVVHRDHALRGVSQGIAQTNHGAKFGVARMKPGDGFLYYSPKDVYPDGHSLRAFTAIGLVAPGEVWQGTAAMSAETDVPPVATQGRLGRGRRRGADHPASRRARADPRHP